MSNALKESLSRQNATERKNFLAVSRLSIQTLCDESATIGVVDDNSEQLVNFCNIIEALLCHKYNEFQTDEDDEINLKHQDKLRNLLNFSLSGSHFKLIFDVQVDKSPSNKKNAGSSDSILYWDFLKLSCKSVPYNCIQKINQIDDVKTTRGKGRAWIRMALMEKRLSEYLSVALMEESIVKKFYLRGSFMLNEEAHILANVLTALNSVDFSLCLRSDVFDLPVTYSIDYAPFLKYPLSDKQLDLEEALIRMERNRIHNDASSTCSGPTSTVSEREPSLEEELTRLKRQMKLVVDQKAYLEEILHLKESKCTELTQQLLKWDKQLERDKAMSDNIIVELQHQLSEQQLRSRQLQDQLSDFRKDGSFEEMEPVLTRSRNSTNISLTRPPELDSLRGVDVVAHMDQNGVSSSSSDKSVRRCSSDQSVRRQSEETLLTSCVMRRSDETMQTRTTSSTSGSSSRPRAKSHFSKQRIGFEVEDILPSEKERLLFHVHKKLQNETFISFGEPDT